LRGGPVAVLAAVGSVVVCALFVSFINRMEPEHPASDSEDEPE
jgi:hypothetical protein